jgi:predicted  nucleic acid-binding Zn-ribbon protein
MDKDVAVVNMLISTGNEVFVSDQADSITIRRGKTFLDSFQPDIEAFDLQQQVNDQQDAVTKAEKKYRSLQDDADDLQKKKNKLEQQIEDNLKAQKEQKAEIEKQKQLFEFIKGKQKN